MWCCWSTLRRSPCCWGTPAWEPTSPPTTAAAPPLTTTTSASSKVLSTAWRGKHATRTVCVCAVPPSTKSCSTATDSACSKILSAAWHGKVCCSPSIDCCTATDSACSEVLSTACHGKVCCSPIYYCRSSATDNNDQRLLKGVAARLAREACDLLGKEKLVSCLAWESLCPAWC